MFLCYIYYYIHYSFILDISIAPLQVHDYSEVLPTQHGYCVGVSHQSATYYVRHSHDNLFNQWGAVD